MTLDSDVCWGCNHEYESQDGIFTVCLDCYYEPILDFSDENMKKLSRVLYYLRNRVWIEDEWKTIAEKPGVIWVVKNVLLRMFAPQYLNLIKEIHDNR